MALNTNFKLGPHVLRNRYVLAPMTRARSPGNIANDLNRQYYERFSELHTGRNMYTLWWKESN